MAPEFDSTGMPFTIRVVSKSGRDASSPRVRRRKGAQSEPLYGLVFPDDFGFNKPEVTIDMVDSWFARLAQDNETSGNSILDQVLVEQTRRIVDALRDYLPVNTDIYVMEEGKIAVEVFGTPGRGFLLVCEPTGGALCIVTSDGESRRSRYESVRKLPDGFLKEGLQEIAPARGAKKAVRRVLMW